MSKTPSQNSRYLQATSLYLGPLQWSITEYYQAQYQNSFSDVIRGLLTIFAENDSEFDPKIFWESGVLSAYERYADDPVMQAQVIKQSLRWLKRAHKWEPDAKSIPKYQDSDS